MRYLVTGGLGFIGSHLVDKLLEAKNSVVVLDSSTDASKIKHHFENPDLKIIRGDIRDKLDSVFEDRFDAIFHLAAIVSVNYSQKNPEETHSVNSLGTLNVLKHCTNRFIFASSAAVYGNNSSMPLREDFDPLPISPYASQKLFGEFACKSYFRNRNIKTICLRFFNVYGPRQNSNGDYASLIPKFIQLVNQSQPPTINGDGNQTRDFVYVEDVVNAMILAASSENKDCFGNVFNIGSGAETSVNQITDALIQISKKQIIPVHNPPILEPDKSVADISKAKDVLKWKPQFSLEWGLKQTYDFFIQDS